MPILLDSSIDNTYKIFMAILIILIVLSVVLCVYFIIRNKTKTDQQIGRLNDIEYTEILKSDGGETGSVTTYSNGNINNGSYRTTPTTKFLVVYVNGDREIVTVNDNSKLCKEYLLRLKTDK